MSEQGTNTETKNQPVSSEEIEAIMKRVAKYNAGNGEKIELPNEWTREAYDKLNAKLPKENNVEEQVAQPQTQDKQTSQKEGIDNGGSEPPHDDKPSDKDNKEKGTLKVNGESEEPSENTDWIEEKRKFWQEYAEKNGFGLKNDPQADQDKKQFTAQLTSGKDGNLGTINYASPNNVSVSKDAKLELYKGVAQDALANNLTVTFGDTLDEKQKALLLAACLLVSTDEKKVEMVNEPKIDMNAEYFKELPKEAQEAIKAHLERQKDKEAKTNQEQTSEKDNAFAKKSQEALARIHQKENPKEPTYIFSEIKKDSYDRSTDARGSINALRGVGSKSGSGKSKGSAQNQVTIPFAPRGRED